MSQDNSLNLIKDNWQQLTQFTSARIALGRTGMSLPTRATLEFQLAHALARDAVTVPLDFGKLEACLHALGFQSLTLQTRAENHSMYLQRPDLGRLLSDCAMVSLDQGVQIQADVVVVVADGLSSTAIEHHAEPFLRVLIPELLAKNYRFPNLCLVKHGRVAIGDAIADYYGARLCIVLIGERPGLSSPDSMGIYFTYNAKSGVSTDANRNCISNIHSNGLDYGAALKKLMYLITESEKLKLSGVGLKDETIENETLDMRKEINFLLE